MKIIKQNKGIIFSRVTKETSYLVLTADAFKEERTFTTQAKEKGICTVSDKFVFDSVQKKKFVENDEYIYWKP